MQHTNTEENLDLIGMSCPYPIMHTQKKMRALACGERLLVKVSDPSFSIDLNVFVRQSGNILLNSWQEGEVIFYLLERSIN